MYQQLGLEELKSTSIVLQLADRSIKKHWGIVEDVIIKVDKFYYPIDFIVLNTEPVPNFSLKTQWNGFGSLGAHQEGWIGMENEGGTTYL